MYMNVHCVQQGGGAIGSVQVLVMVRVGRPREPGERYPSGKLKHRQSLKPKVEPMSGAAWQRIRAHAKQIGADARLATEVGRLNLFGEFTAAMAIAAFRIGEIYGRYEGFKRLVRQARSPSYESSYGEAGADEDRLDKVEFAKHIERIKEAEAKWLELQEKHLELLPRNLRFAVEELCVADKPISPALYEDMRHFLQKMATVWNIQGLGGNRGPSQSSSVRSGQRPSTAVRNGRGGGPLHFNQHMDAAAGEGGKIDVKTESTLEPVEKRPNAERIAFMAVVKKIAPHLSAEQQANVFEFKEALKQREIFRRSHAVKGSNVVKIHRQP